ncbi:proton-conducting transporter membrane subunit [Desulfosporosinus meridiei]|uniref:Formate hydrogenlyase subunit 3/multisubunit Na+/H+ antiporter, MnhD subunit n=1 Tax=Desulfosporosinus meridiei (strain ATCC BAA-275 / DSM 13257 / KCTC 12902 / NCIMB 13706 / S10) TaxID=768704 RepID=J7INJ6_DESMD|nr:proton-conducting transporter membrane subunit [Desulfosporosinus meridiei]AFQ43180.1 formate hydrogenlyase subunit 3/multisubunit Na+/H+ antiporter, MnhD subunit [Desulfosporosinus meridiei DSM 13257]
MLKMGSRPINRFLSLCILLAGVVLVWGTIVTSHGGDWLVRGLRFFTEEGAGRSLTWKVDGLTIFFLFILLLGQCLSSLYAMGYLKEYEEGNKSLWPFYGAWFLFLGSMVSVLLADDGFTFLLTWEMMSLFSFFLVLYEHENPQNRKAAYIYLIMTHVGTVFLTAATLYLYTKTGSFAFQVWADSSSTLSTSQLNLLFIAFFIGLGTKAGLVPLHIWLPYAHSSAPSPVSSLMSGVMVKVALYLFLRIVWLAFGPGMAWWGWLFLLVGALSATVGILLASVQTDLKKLLAFSTIENIGILSMALGSAFLARFWQNEWAMNLALIAFFWHSLQHMLFKTLLFMSAGNIIQATHTRNLEQLGGLLKRMPKTGFGALIGVIGITALPPLGGFWGELMIFQSLWLNTIHLANGWSKAVLPLFIGVLALVGGLSMATFVKWFGIAFLGQARSNVADKAREVQPVQYVAPFIIIILAVLTVLWPSATLALINFPLLVLKNGEVSGLGSVVENSIHMASVYLIIFTLLTLVVFTLSKRGKQRVTATWNCGSPLTLDMQYSATGLTKPIRILFAKAMGSHRQVERDFAGTRYSLRSLSYEGEIKATFEDYFYRPLIRGLLWLAAQIRKLQEGSIHLYLGYLLLTVIVVLFLGR